MKIHPIVHYISTAIVLFSDGKIEHIFSPHFVETINLLSIFNFSCLWVIVILFLHLSNVYNIMRCAIKDLEVHVHFTELNQESSIRLRWAINQRGLRLIFLWLVRNIWRFLGLFNDFDILLARKTSFFRQVKYQNRKKVFLASKISKSLKKAKKTSDFRTKIRRNFDHSL